MYNPYANNNMVTPVNNYNQQFQYQQLPHYDIIQVNGKAGVDAFKMGPNSSTILVKVFLANTQMSNYDIIYILEEQNIGR